MTFVYVTHDQEEALTMSDRIAVFNTGRIEQIGTPAEMYERPATEFVAGFVGTSNVLDRDGRTFTVRPEKIRLLTGDEAAADGATVEAGQVQDVSYVGVMTRYVVDLDRGGQLVVARQNETAPAEPGGLRGSRVRLAWHSEQAFAVRQGPGPDHGDPGRQER